MRYALLLSFCLLGGQMPAQQLSQAPATFAVATIKPSAADTRTMTQIRGNRFVTEGTTFLDLFKYAYDVHPDQVVGGPEWLRTEKFDVVADPETEKRPSSAAMKALVQQLLVDRFHVVMHRGQKLLPAYALVRTAGTPRLTKSTADPGGVPGVAYDPSGSLNVTNATMANFATFLQRFVLDRPAVDQTGISGHFDLALRWSPESLGTEPKADTSAAGNAAPNLFTAIPGATRVKARIKEGRNRRLYDQPGGATYGRIEVFSFRFTACRWKGFPCSDGGYMPQNSFNNTLLRHLSSETIRRLRLRRVDLALGQDLEVPGQNIESIFFVEQGIGSMTTVFRDGFEVEVGMFGYESAVGISALMGTKHSLNRIFMQLPGYGFASPVMAAEQEFTLHGEFHRLALRYVQAQLTQATQSAACNVHHNHEQRFARWILICSDRAKQDVMSLSQEFLADMLGSARPTVTATARILKAKGLITYSRGKLVILDRVGLENQACECYQVVKDHLENFAEFDTGFVV